MFTVAIKVGALLLTFYCQEPAEGIYTCFDPVHGHTYTDKAPLTQSSFAAFERRVAAERAEQDACRRRGGMWGFGHLPTGGAGWFCT